MNTKHLNSEKGQAIVYLAVGLVVFLGFVALAIDGGMVLADRRNSQNAADAAALAGAGKAASEIDRANKYYHANITDQTWDCTKLGFAINDAEFAAQSRATENKFDIDYPRGTHDNNYVDATCNTAGKYIDVTVDILSTTQSNFLQVVFPNALQNHVVAVTRVFPGKPLAGGNAIVALNPETCAGASKTGAGFRGNSTTVVTGGGIWSNGCLTGGGSATVNVEGGYGISFNDAPWYPKNPPPTLFNPPPVSVNPLQILPETYAVPEPHVNSSGECDDPGAHNITVNTLNHLNADLDLNILGGAGLWCITGDKNTPLSINSQHPITGNGVTLYVVPKIAVEINGGAGLTLSAPAADAKPPAIPGMLFYMSPSNPNPLTINGNSAIFSLTGTILAPASHIKINGTTGLDLEVNCQIIGWDVEMIGGAITNITYDHGLNATLPPSMELHK
jgi:Flp pilus assembly protein TadG